MGAEVRVRFAPSPTGPLHIGGVRTALYNYLFAKKHQGRFILRIEDTDQNRYVEGAEKYIIDSLNWCGIPYDEGPSKDGGYGPYRQSERKEIYKKYADQLVADGKAYLAFDSSEELDAHRKDQESQGNTFIYNWANRLEMKNSISLSEDEVANLLQQGVPFVIRFKVTEKRSIQLKDEVRGSIEIDTSTLDDKILFKSDGMPTYHLANVVDDHLMEISHVIRGEEWLPSLALHYLLYEAFGWKPPVFAHLPLILKPSGKGKLSKRDGDKMGFPIFPLSWEDSVGYRESGYYPEAVTNFLAMLGWNPGSEEEFFDLPQLISLFSLERVHKGGARFDPEKTRWYNHHYLQQRPADQLVEDLKSQQMEIPESATDAYLVQVFNLLKERLHFAKEIFDLGGYFFSAPVSYSDKAVRKHWKAETANYMEAIRELLSDISDFNSEEIEKEVKEWITAREIGFGKVMAPLRLAIVGDLQGPHLFDIMALLGRQECVERISNAINTIAVVE